MFVESGGLEEVDLIEVYTQVIVQGGIGPATDCLGATGRWVGKVVEYPLDSCCRQSIEVVVPMYSLDSQVVVPN